MNKTLFLGILAVSLVAVGCGSSPATTEDIKQIQAEAKSRLPKDLPEGDASKLNTDLVGFEGRGSGK
ncbi:MAG TPA: hypothetical protein VGE01_12075 [Fimbriimonas sp.]